MHIPQPLRQDRVSVGAVFSAKPSESPVCHAWLLLRAEDMNPTVEPGLNLTLQLNPIYNYRILPLRQ